MARPKCGWDNVWRTSDELAFINGLGKVELERYLVGFKRRTFDVTVNRRMVLNMVVKRLKEAQGRI